ncbi:MAG TPA: hypothetical protein VK886_08240 [Vicinamibacterales bacterium]|nr:hypothetical protein [Vicinamibacterales bacterium]
MLLAPARATADSILLFDNFGPGNTFGPDARPILGPGYALSEGDVTPGQWFATSFPVFRSGPFAFTGIDLELSVLKR